jgi:hypothetical protein
VLLLGQRGLRLPVSAIAPALSSPYIAFARNRSDVTVFRRLHDTPMPQAGLLLSAYKKIAAPLVAKIGPHAGHEANLTLFVKDT